MKKYVIIGIIVVLGGIQFFGIEKTNPESKAEIGAPKEVMELLKRSCYDCHSNTTVWPWYTDVAPISWWVASDVEHGREELNFSEWAKYPRDKQHDLMQEILRTADEGDMPPWGYMVLHSDSKLTLEDRETLRGWIKKQTGTEPTKRIF